MWCHKPQNETLKSSSENVTSAKSQVAAEINVKREKHPAENNTIIAEKNINNNSGQTNTNPNKKKPQELKFTTQSTETTANQKLSTHFVRLLAKQTTPKRKFFWSQCSKQTASLEYKHNGTESESETGHKKL